MGLFAHFPVLSPIGARQASGRRAGRGEIVGARLAQGVI